MAIKTEKLVQYIDLGTYSIKYGTFKISKETNEIWYRVRIGSYDKRDTAVAVAKSLSSTRPEPAWVDYVRYEN